MTALEYCEENNIDLSSFAKVGKSVVSSDDETVIYAIEELHNAGYSYTAIASCLKLQTTFIAKVLAGDYKKTTFSTGRVLDVGKIKALHKAGWKPMAISYDVGCDLSQVLEVLEGK